MFVITMACKRLHDIDAIERGEEMDICVESQVAINALDSTKIRLKCALFIGCKNLV